MHPTLSVADALAAAGWERTQCPGSRGAKQVYEDQWSRRPNREGVFIGYGAVKGTALWIERDEDYSWRLRISTWDEEGYKYKIIDTGYHCPLTLHNALVLEGDGEMYTAVGELLRGYDGDWNRGM